MKGKENTAMSVLGLALLDLLIFAYLLRKT